jgi:hypothetical protein
MLAAKGGHPGVAQLLLDWGANINFKNFGFFSVRPPGSHDVGGKSKIIYSRLYNDEK